MDKSTYVKVVKFLFPRASTKVAAKTNVYLLGVGKRRHKD